MTTVRALLFSAWLATSVTAIVAHAHEGHDDSAPSPSAAIAGGNPRVEATSDLFEIVGIVENGVMTIFLDRYATNDPIANARIEIEIGPVKGSTQQSPDGTYTFKHAVLSQPAQLPVTFAVAAGGDSDLLTGDLVISDPNAVNAYSTIDFVWKWWWWAAGGLVLGGVLAIAWLLRRRQRLKETVQ